MKLHLITIFSFIFILGYFIFFYAKKDYKEQKFFCCFYISSFFAIIAKISFLLGRKISYFISLIIALIFGIMHPRLLRIIHANISIIQSQFSCLDCLQVCIHMAKNFADYGYLLYGNYEKLTTLVDQHVGDEIFSKKYPHGLLVVTGHIGFFELGGIFLHQLGMNVSIITHKEPSLELTNWKIRMRERWGVKTIIIGEDHFSSIQIIRELNKGHTIAILIDRPNTNHSCTVVAPNGKMNFSIAPVLLSLLANCPIVPVVSVRSNTAQINLEVGKLIQPYLLNEGREKTLEYFTQCIANELLPMCAKYYQQWFHFNPISSEQRRMN